MLKYDRYTIMVFVVLFSFACEPPEHNFSAEELKKIDSLYKQEIELIKPRLDTLCESIHQANYDKLVDSLKFIRQKEILEIISK